MTVHLFKEPYIIGDRLNTGNLSIREAIMRKDADFIRNLAERQIGNGASALDIAAGASGDDELTDAIFIRGCLAGLNITHCIDSQVPKIVSTMITDSANAILNCYSGVLTHREEMLAAICNGNPLAVIAVCFDSAGTHVTAKHRLDIAKRLADELADADVTADSIIFDPVTMPSSCGIEAEEVTFATCEMIREAFPKSGVLIAVSNYSFGSANDTEAEIRLIVKARQAGASVFLLNALNAELCRLIEQ